jgi:hypothetical protein
MTLRSSAQAPGLRCSHPCTLTEVMQEASLVAYGAALQVQSEAVMPKSRELVRDSIFRLTTIDDSGNLTIVRESDLSLGHQS